MGAELDNKRPNLTVMSGGSYRFHVTRDGQLKAPEGVSIREAITQAVDDMVDNEARGWPSDGGAINMGRALLRLLDEIEALKTQLAAVNGGQQGG